MKHFKRIFNEHNLCYRQRHAGVNQITTEGFSVIQSVNRVFWIGDIAGLNEYLSHHKIHHEDLSYLYEDGGIDVDNYTRIIQYISDALTECEHVGLIVPGHPRVGVTIVQLLQKSSQDKAFYFSLLSWNFKFRRDDQ